MQIKTFNLFIGFTSQEANMIASGLGYRGKREKEPEEFNAIRAVNIKQCEMIETPV